MMHQLLYFALGWPSAEPAWLHAVLIGMQNRCGRVSKHDGAAGLSAAGSAAAFAASGEIVVVAQVLQLQLLLLSCLALHLQQQSGKHALPA
jgi:hypothetical protein